MSSAAEARWPDFYIVGAPRCGTTFLWDALRRHPGVFMPAHKEPLYFCSDLDTDAPGDRRAFIRREAEYLALFRNAPSNAVVGEAGVMNLFSKVAAARIRAVRDDARIVISLREPVAQIISFHASRYADGVEDLALREALAAEPERAQGRRIPAHARIVPAYQYRAVARYAEQIERYLEVFPPDQILFVNFEDLRADAPAVVTGCLRFLGAAPTSLTTSQQRIDLVERSSASPSGCIVWCSWAEVTNRLARIKARNPSPPLTGDEPPPARASKNASCSSWRVRPVRRAPLSAYVDLKVVVAPSVHLP